MGVDPEEVFYVYVLRVFISLSSHASIENSEELLLIITRENQKGMLSLAWRWGLIRENVGAGVSLIKHSG